MVLMLVAVVGAVVWFCDVTIGVRSAAGFWVHSLRVFSALVV